MYVKAKTTEEKLIDLVKELAGHLEDVLYFDSRASWISMAQMQIFCDRAKRFANKSDKRRNEIYKQQGE
jgi:hypothetical protein